MIFDDLARQYGLTPRPQVEATQMLPPHQPSSRPRPPAAPPPQVCTRCVERDRPLVLIHRHLDEVAGSIHHRMSYMEAHVMAALDDLNAQLDNLKQTVDSTVVPLLNDLAQKAAAGATGIPAADVQSAADRLSSQVSDLATAAQQAQQASVGTPAG